MAAAAGATANSNSNSNALPLVECCAFAFDTIVNVFDANHKPLPPPPVADKFPMFVTWKKLQSDEKTYHLRGCIGTFAASELSAGIKKYAHTSAFKDSRFKPLTAVEVPRLKCHVSLLTDFEAGKDCDDWKIGVHGIQIDFTDSKASPSSDADSYSATYLPEVAKEQGWTTAETIRELVAKSGYTGPVNAQLKSRIKLTRYQSKGASLTYAQYTALRPKPKSK